LTKFLVVFDVDSTLINEEAIELLAERAGTRELVAEVTERAMRGELDFSQSLIERVATLKGLPESILAEVSQELTPTHGAKELIAAIHERGGKAAAVSGGFIQLLAPVKEKLGFDLERANTLEVVDGKLTGKVLGKIIDRQAKADSLIEWAQLFEVSVDQTIAVGDGANDLGMMEVAGLSVAFCAKPVVQQKAKIALNERDLAKLIELLPA
jgi:phosphoserine phosphatase